MLIGIAGILAVISAYLFFPGRTNVLILGIDDRQEGQAVGRSDTMILTSFQPLPGKVSLLSIPRFVGQRAGAWREPDQYSPFLCRSRIAWSRDPGCLTGCCG